MPLNTLGFAAGVVIAQKQGVESDQVMRVALPAAILPNTALGVAVSDILAQQGAASETLPASIPVVSAPAISNVSPDAGPTSGGTPVTITGTGLEGATTVMFGSAAATFFTNADGTITATSPQENAATVHITVTGPGGTSAPSSADQFTFAATPTVTSISPNQGPQEGQTPVQITGTNLLGAAAVMFGSAPADFTVDSATEITAKSPTENPGRVDVTVVTPGGTSATSAQFTFLPAPKVTQIKPPTGKRDESITIVGTNLAGATAVSFGGAPATIQGSPSATHVRAVVPDQGTNPPVVHVTVTTPGGASAPASEGADLFTYTGGTITRKPEAPGQPQLVPVVEISPPQSSAYKRGDVIKVASDLWQGVGPDARPRFQWYRDGEEVERDGHSAQYKVKATDEGSKLQVQVIYGNERTGYVSTTSSPIEIRKQPTRRSSKQGDGVEEVIIETA